MKHLLFAALLITAMPAMAGSVMIADRAGAIPPQQIDTLHNQIDVPFDVSIQTGSFPSKGALDQAVASCVNSPNVLCIGVDPSHHATNVHFGKGLGVGSENFSRVSSAGNPFFKNGDWAGGLAAIVNTANASRVAVVVPQAPVPPVTYQPPPVYQPPQPTYQPPPQPAPVPAAAPIQNIPTAPVVNYQPYVPQPQAAPAPVQQSGGHGFLIFLIMAAAVGGVGFFIYRAFSSSNINVVPQPWSKTPTSGGSGSSSSVSTQRTRATTPFTEHVVHTAPSAPTPIVVNAHSGPDPLIAGVAGFALGQMTAHHHDDSVRAVPTPTFVPAPTRPADGGGATTAWDQPAPTAPFDNGGGSSSWNTPAPTPAPSSNDSGGSSSGWDSSPSSDDSGSSSSSWDSGSDSGSSSSDWGSSSSDSSSGSSDSSW